MPGVWILRRARLFVRRLSLGNQVFSPCSAHVLTDSGIRHNERRSIIHVDAKRSYKLPQREHAAQEPSGNRSLFRLATRELTTRFFTSGVVPSIQPTQAARLYLNTDRTFNANARDFTRNALGHSHELSFPIPALVCDFHTFGVVTLEFLSLLR